MINVSSTAVNDHVKVGNNGNKTNDNSNKNLNMEKGRKKERTVRITSTARLLNHGVVLVINENIRSIVDIKKLDSYNSLGYFEVKLRMATFFSHHNPPKQCQIRLLTRKDQILHIWLAIQVQVRH